jgi:acyl-CoA thioesterase FadM
MTDTTAARPVKRTKLVDSFETHVIMPDTDAAGVLYHTAPSRWAEVGFENLLRRAGMPLEDVLPRDLHYPVVSVKIDHFSPLALGRRVTVKTGVVRIGKRSVEVLAVVTDETGKLACTVRRVAVAKSRSGQEVVAEPVLAQIACSEQDLGLQDPREAGA